MQNLDDKILVSQIGRLGQPLDMPLVNMWQKLIVEKFRFWLVFDVHLPEYVLKEGMLFGWIDVAGEEMLEELSDFFVGLGFEHD